MTLIPVNTNALAHQSPGIAEMAVSSYLEQARDWLATAVEQTGPEQVALRKAEIATAAEATKQLGLSKEIQLDAQEMVRRAEYALARSIRRGQEEGTVSKSSDNQHADGATVRRTVARPTDFAPDVELYDRPSQNKTGILGFADNATPEQFDTAIAEAKDEGNLSRANVARKIRKQDCDKGPSRADKAEIIRDLAAKGWTSEQMCKEVGYARGDRVREVAREFDITIPGDVVTRKTRRINNDRVLDNVTEALEVAAISLRDVDPAQLDKESALERLDSLTSSISALRQATKKIKESLRD